MSRDHPLGERLAGEIFEAQHLRDTLENVLFFALGKAFRSGGEDEPEFKRFDYYDASVEFWAERGAVLDEIDLAVLAVLGFQRCWVCYRGDPYGETFYSCRQSEDRG